MINNGYTHRDLKPENILIKYIDENKINFDIKLSDFGLSTDEIHTTIETHTSSGTYIYMAPEIETNYYNNKCDLWSLGVILYELYTNEYIFYSNNSIEQNNNRYEGKIVKETDNEMINKLIKKLIQVDINKRIEWEEYFNDDFFKINNIENNDNNYKQIIKIKIKVNKDNEEIKIYNGNKDINENNIILFIENKEIKFEKVINNLKKGNYNLIIEINQNIYNCEDMFKNCEYIIEIEFINCDTKYFTNMSGMFYGCKSLNNLNISNFDTKNVTDMSRMFYFCESLNNLNLSNFDTKNVTNMSGMFFDCKFEYDKKKFKDV